MRARLLELDGHGAARTAVHHDNLQESRDVDEHGGSGRPDHGEGTYRVADHFVDRLAELGVDRIFGIPGTAASRCSTHVVHHPTVRWTGCINQLNAGYAADGYVRLRGIAALCTTLRRRRTQRDQRDHRQLRPARAGGAVVGAPTLATLALRRPVHHSLGDGEFGHFMAMHAAITCAAR